MVVCELDKEVSGEILGWKLPAWQALLLHRVIPSCGGLVLYLTVMCFDLALTYEHFQNGDEAVGVFCTVLIVLPAILCLIFTLASPPPGLQTDLSAFSVTLDNNDVKWIFIQIANTVFFPVAAVGRYCYLIFWWIETIYACNADDEERINEAISNARAPSPLELYLFLQAFLHSAPHAIVNILDMMAQFANPTYSKVTLQAICIIAASLRMASAATIYRRFQREKICGRQYPWNIKLVEETDNTHNENDTNIQPNTNKSADETPFLRNQSSISQKSDSQRHQVNSDMIKFSPRSSEMDAVFYDDMTWNSDTSSDYLPPTTPHKEHLDSDDEYVRPISIIDRVAPRRRETQHTIERVNITPPPVTPAPRPGSLAMWAEKLVENAESIPEWLSAPPRRKHWEVIEDEPDLPRRAPRSFIRGLEPQDATAALVNFLGWYLFFVARLFSIAAFINFFPIVAIIILFSHYQVMLLCLIVPQASSVKRAFYMFLAFIYLFCLMEFKIRFRHVRVWHVFWIIVCTIEIVLFISLWATVDNRFHIWWRWYVVIITLGSMSLSYMCFLVYFVLLKPKETIVYLKKTNKSSTA